MLSTFQDGHFIVVMWSKWWVNNSGEPLHALWSLFFLSNFVTAILDNWWGQPTQFQKRTIKGIFRLNLVAFYPVILTIILKDFQYFQQIRSNGGHFGCLSRSPDISWKEGHPRIIICNPGPIWQRDSWEEDQNVKKNSQMTDTKWWKVLTCAFACIEIKRNEIFRKVQETVLKKTLNKEI